MKVIAVRSIRGVVRRNLYLSNRFTYGEVQVTRSIEENVC